jgi:predicted TIM-barrel fold metal-dependent hydrolase
MSRGQGQRMADPNYKVNFPPDPNPRPPRFAVPAESWDSHFHVLAPHLFPYLEKRRYTPPAAPLEHYLAIARALGLDRGCVVQSSFHGTDSRVIGDAVARSDGRLKGMIRVDPDLTLQDIHRLHAAGIRGMRLPTLKGFGDSFDAGKFQKIVDLMQPVGWILSIQLGPQDIVEHAERIERAGIPVIIDTWARIDPRIGFDQPAFAALLTLLATAQVWVKIHGTNRFLEWGVPYGLMIDMAHRLIAAAPRRILWGTDWPHGGIFETNKMPNDGDLINMLIDYAPGEADRRRVLVDNPRALFDF